MVKSIEQHVLLAKSGDKAALEAVMKTVQSDVYAIALRFLWHPHDAEDATQEILIKVMTHLSSFRGDSRFTTWVYRIASNTLLTLNKKRMETQPMSFDAFAADLAQGLSDHEYDNERPDSSRLLDEIKVGCTLALLQCLDRKHRLAYILGDIIMLDHNDAADTLDVSQASYRKLLSRARQKIESFMLINCGLVNTESPCRCDRRVDTAITLGRVDPKNLLFSHVDDTANSFSSIFEKIQQLDQGRRAAELYRSYKAPVNSQEFLVWLRRFINDMATPEEEYSPIRFDH